MPQATPIPQQLTGLAALGVGLLILGIFFLVQELRRRR